MVSRSSARGLRGNTHAFAPIAHQKVPVPLMRSSKPEVCEAAAGQVVGRPPRPRTSGPIFRHMGSGAYGTTHGVAAQIFVKTLKRDTVAIDATLGDTTRDVTKQIQNKA